MLQLDTIGSPAVVLTPRRESFPVGQVEAKRQQVAWEYEHLRIADVILFWFCAEAVQPIALHELGAHAARGSPARRTHPLLTGLAGEWRRPVPRREGEPDQQATGGAWRTSSNGRPAIRSIVPTPVRRGGSRVPRRPRAGHRRH
ncbi:nucleoside 2-deoxyribosyltransferase domain-containing protein [Streptomyces olindensis]|uniref:nucleoside 2-deoxyribosyltransferase domain-containing protein n=1 Tax=Streptomyces olindensis TaxID=358823 RepID=UPI0033F9C065